jgi:hypothetical protein
VFTDIHAECQAPAVQTPARGPWKLLGAAIAGGAALSLLGRHWSDLSAQFLPAFTAALDGAEQAATTLESPLGDLTKLVVAALIGLVITAVQRRAFPERIVTPSMEQAQVLLTVAGALMMMVIGNSLARAFGIAGAASIVRFRTPVEDPRDVTVLFLLMGLGMAAGLGAVALAALGTAFLACCLILLVSLGGTGERCVKVTLVANGTTFPSRQVEALLASRRVQLEPLELTVSEAAEMRYRARISRDASLDELSSLLLGNGETGIKSVSWEATRKA